MKIVDVYKQGDGNTTLSKCLNIPRWINSWYYQVVHCVENKLRTGRKRLIFERMERKIVRDVSKNPCLMTKDIVNDVKTSGLNVSMKTVIRCFH